MEKFFADTAVIGGGASGMLCASVAAEKNRNKKVILIEKEEKTGRKLLATGNGRCNLANLSAVSGSYYGSFRHGAEALLSEYTPAEVLRRFELLGLVCRVEPDGRVYPLSRHSASVAQVLNLALKRNAVAVLNGFNVEGLKKDKHKFIISGKNGIVTADNVVVCSGGRSASRLGSDGSMFPLLGGLGHSVTPMFPALCPLNCADKSLKILKGVRCSGEAALYSGNKLIRREKGEIQFTEKALSGICVFNLSRFVYGLDNPVVRVSLLPDYSENKLFLLLSRHRDIFSSEPAQCIFTGMFHKNVGESLIKRAGIKAETCSQITDGGLHLLASLINDWRFNVSGSAGFESSQVTAGGINGGEIDPDTLESKIVKNLYFCGEVIDADGGCGGYNLQFAFACALKVGDRL